jgi:hypothetical protein
VLPPRHRSRVAFIPAAVAVAAAMVQAVPARAGGPVTLGLSAGFAAAGDQDVKVLQYAPDGALTDWEHLQGQSVDGGPFAALALTFWPPTRADHSAFRLELDAWRATADIDSRISGPVSVEQRRLALIASWVVRLPLGAEDDPERYAYVGVGGGVVAAAVTAEGGGIGPAFSALAGLRIPLGRHVGAHVELRLMTAADVEARHHDRLQYEVSGGASSRIPGQDAHLDANFVPITIGVDWRL